MLTPEQLDFFHANGYIRLEQVFPPDELARMSADLNYIIDTFADWGAAWKGEWLKEYMKDEAPEKKAALVAIHELHVLQLGPALHQAPKACVARTCSRKRPRHVERHDLVALGRSELHAAIGRARIHVHDRRHTPVGSPQRLETAA